MTDEATALYGVEMTPAEVDEFLVEQGVGMLALADDGDAYAVPISFGYDGADALYFFLIRFGEDSRKLSYLETTTEATFAVATVESSTSWKSVVVAGEIEEVPGDERERMEEVMYDNALAARLFPYEEPITSITRARLRIDRVTGRKGMGDEH